MTAALSSGYVSNEKRRNAVSGPAGAPPGDPPGALVKPILRATVF